MKKVLIADISEMNILLNAFDLVEPTKPKLLSQVNVSFHCGIDKALQEIENDIGPISREPFGFYVVLPNKEEFQDLRLDDKGSSPIYLNKNEVINDVANLVLEEVGDVLILDINRGEISVHLLKKDEYLLTEVDLGKLKVEYEEGMNNVTIEGLVLLEESIDQKIEQVVEKFALKHDVHNLAKLRWVIGTGEVLAKIPNSMEILRQALANTKEVTFEEDGFPVLIDQYNIFISIGVLSHKYREGAWQLFLESLGVV